MMINLRELFLAIDLSGASFPATRVANLLVDLSVMLENEELELPLEKLARLKEQYRTFLQTTDAEPATVRNKVSRLNQLIQMATQQGLIPGHEGIPLPPRPEKAGPARRRYNGLCLFDAWLRTNGIPVTEVSNKTFRVYRDELRGRGATCSEDQYNCAVRCWRELADKSVVQDVEPPRWSDGSKEDYGLPYDQWPPAFASDFKRFCLAASGNAMPGEKRRKLLRHESIKDLQRELSRLLGYLVNIRGDVGVDSSLFEVLSDRHAIVDFISWHITERCDGAERKHHGESLNWFARLLEWFDGSTETVEHYRMIAKSLKTQRARDPFPERPITYEEFSSAAQRALESAKREWIALGPRWLRSQETISAAIAYRDALLFAFLVCRPMRSRNMREMKLGLNVYKAGEVWRLRFAKEDMKAKVYSCRFPVVIVPYLEFYLAEIRPFLARGGNTKELFLTKSGKPIGRSDFWKIMTKAGCRIMGLKTNPHLFRYLIPSAYLLRYPDRALQMQALLGHSVLEVTLRFYVHVYSRVASQRAAEVLRQHCPAMVELGQLFPPPQRP
jgi:integrase